MRLFYLKHSGFDASQFVVSRREGGWSTHFTFDFFGYELTFNKEKSIYFSFENLIFYRPLLLKDIKFEKKNSQDHQALLSQTAIYRDKGSLCVFI